MPHRYRTALYLLQPPIVQVSLDMPPAPFFTSNNPLFVPFRILFLGFSKAQIRLIPKILHRLALIHEKPVQILYCDTLPRLKGGHEIPFTELRLCAYHAKALKNALILDLFSLRVGACVPVPNLPGKLILELPQLVLQMPV